MTIFFLVLIEWTFYTIESFRIRTLCIGRYSFPAIFQSRLLSVFLGNVLPGAASAEVARIILLDRYNKVGNKLFIAFVFLSNRIYGLLAMILVFSISTIINPVLAEKLGLDYALIMAMPILVFLPLCFNLNSFRQILIAIYGKTSGRLRHFFRIFYLSLKSSSNASLWLKTISSSVVTCLLVALQLWLCGDAVGVAVSFSTWIFIVTVMSLAIFLPIGVGAFGTQDLSLVMLGKFLGKPPEVFLAISALLHVARIFGSLPGAIFLKTFKKYSQEK